MSTAAVSAAAPPESSRKRLRTEWDIATHELSWQLEHARYRFRLLSAQKKKLELLERICLLQEGRLDRDPPAGVGEAAGEEEPCVDVSAAMRLCERLKKLSSPEYNGEAVLYLDNMARLKQSEQTWLAQVEAAHSALMSRMREGPLWREPAFRESMRAPEMAMREVGAEMRKLAERTAAGEYNRCMAEVRGGKYFVFRIRDRKRVGRGFRYEVEWFGFHERTWEPRSQLMRDIPEMVLAFDATCQARAALLAK